VPNAINLALSDSVTVGPADGEILVALDTPHHPTAGYLKTLREELPRRFPDLEFFTQPADIVSQILNFGLPAPIDIQVTGPIAEAGTNLRVAQQIATDLREFPARWTSMCSRSSTRLGSWSIPTARSPSRSA